MRMALCRRTVQYVCAFSVKANVGNPSQHTKIGYPVGKTANYGIVRYPRGDPVFSLGSAIVNERTFWFAGLRRWRCARGGQKKRREDNGAPPPLACFFYFCFDL